VASVEVSSAGLDAARSFLARLEDASGVPPVDEDEQRRLAGDEPIRDRDWSWGSHLSYVDGVPVAYAGTRLPPAGEHVAGAPDSPTAVVGVGCAARVDLAVDRSQPTAAVALVAALADARDHVRRRAVDGDATQAGRVEAWLRGATADDLSAAQGVGFDLVKRLHVMAMPLDADAVRSDVTAPALSAGLADGMRVRRFDADASEDTAAVVDLLSAAYPGSEGGWDEAGFAVRRDTDWFRAEDLLLLEDGGSEDVGSADGGDGGDGARRLIGVHWTKRRGEGVGEVHNLALAPSARGRGLGGVLLDAGLAHLAAAGCHEVILWVDAQNAPALALYRSRGFETRWDDVALVG